MTTGRVCERGRVHPPRRPVFTYRLFILCSLQESSRTNGHSGGCVDMSLANVSHVHRDTLSAFTKTKGHNSPSPSFPSRFRQSDWASTTDKVLCYLA